MALVLLVAGLIGCSRARSTEAVRPGGTEVASSSPHLEPAGTPMRDGLVVPHGAHLAGAVFVERDDVVERNPAPTTSIGPKAASILPWEALLTVEGDPFAAWDDLVAQLRRTLHVAMPGSPDSCLWTSATPGTEAPPKVVALAPPPSGTDGIICEAGAGRGDHGRVQWLMLTMIGEHDRKPLTIHVQSRWSTGSRAPRPTALAASLVRHGRAGEDIPDPGSGPMPAGKAEQVPTFPPQPHAGPGQPFGTAVNCFVTDAYRMRVPEGGSLVATSDFGELAVVAVDDLDAALADVRLQVEGPTRDPTSEVERWRLDLPSGRRVVHYGHAVLAGGGFCGFTRSRDGRYLLVTLNAD